MTPQTDEIHVDILNAHLQFVTPFLKQHGVEYERDRFTEKLDGGEISLDMTHLWLHRAIRQLRVAAGVASTAPSPGPAGSSSSSVLARSISTSPQSASVVSQDVLFYRQLLSDLEQKRGDAYLKLLRVAIVDNLLGAIVRVERNKPGPRIAIGDSGGVSVAEASKAEALASTAAERDDQQEDMLEGVAVPETLVLDRYRLVVIAAGAEQAAYTASLVAFARQALAAARVQLARTDENRVRKALMVLFETEDVTSADICAQVWLRRRRKGRGFRAPAASHHFIARMRWWPCGACRRSGIVFPLSGAHRDGRRHVHVSPHCVNRPFLLVGGVERESWVCSVSHRIASCTYSLS